MHLGYGIRSVVRRLHAGRRLTLQWRNSMFQNTPRLSRGQQKFLGTFWQYFNAPGNAFFVTTNVVTLTGMMLYSTVSTMSRQANILDSLENGFGVESSLDQNYEDTKVAVLPKRLRSEVSWKELSPIKQKEVQRRDPQPIIESNSIAANAEAKEDPALDSYTDQTGLQSPKSYMSKMAIFYLFYSYHIYKKSLETGVEINDKALNTLLTSLPSDVNTSSTVQNAAFYKSWRHEFGVLFKNLSKAQHFNIPKPGSFPEELQEVFTRLSQNNMTSQSDFYDFYQSINDNSQRRLLQLWYYDNSRNFLKRNSFSSEKIFQQMVFESSQWNNDLFEKYISVLYRPGSHHFRSMFNNYFNGMTSISLDTVLTVLKGLIASNVKHKNDHIVKVVSLLRKNSLVSSKKNLRIIIPTQDKVPLLEKMLTADVRKSTYLIMAKNPVALKLLSTLGGVKSD
ncbi:unnamed protein product [Kluyveromyces dobzhanskii CBS 2104]|uniref:WGS project CCBQ000000000 data, contig 00106 n=1 Tax=Kluyveromyces dobzhanskii CBS 2104 TaxID=1427455 RepID=A0A0A8L7K9_9SACH|nr:unnamed protein product [Kluyveromyces dobzhanskii CBS 2104]